VNEEDQVRGRAVKRLRERHLWSRRELARRAGISPSAVAPIEEGRVHVQLATIGKLANALGVAPDVLLYPEEYVEEIYPKGLVPTSSRKGGDDGRRALRDFRGTVLVAKELARLWREEPMPSETLTNLERRLAIAGVRVALTDAGRRYAEEHGQALPDNVHAEADEALLVLETVLGDSRSMSEQLAELIEAKDIDMPVDVEAYGAFIQEMFQEALQKTRGKGARRRTQS
jgi:transcriptional regulator with XRE-family HTH domain